MSIVGNAIAYVMGVITGAAGKYLADRFTDRRRQRESTRTERQRFEDTIAKMPELFAEMKKDLSAEGHPLIREFFISRRSWILNTAG